MKKNFKEVQKLMNIRGYTIVKNRSHTYFHYDVVSPAKVLYHFVMKGGMVELYDNLYAHKDNLEDYIKNNSRSNTNDVKKISSKEMVIKISTSKRGSKKIKIKNNKEINFIPSMLKKRNDNNITTAVNYGNIKKEPTKTQKFISAETNEIDYNVKVPKDYKDYYFPANVNNIINRIKLGRPVFISGNVGTGKTELIYKLGDFLGQKVLRVNFSVGTTEANLIGKFIVKNQETIFIEGVLPMAMRNGWWILFDEIDYAMPEHLAILQPVLEGDNLIVTINENEEIKPHTNFRMFATANTKGRGDETQSFTGTNFLNLAFLDRWSVFELSYTEQEPNIIHNIINDGVLTKQIYTYFELLRKAISNGEILNAVFSTRRMVQFCESLAIGESLKDALNYEIWTRYDTHETALMKELSYDVWDKSHYLSKHWKIGDEHIQIIDLVTPESIVATPIVVENSNTLSTNNI